ncbi:MAG: hypothetical protein H8D82_00535 [Euryarchaeota archaeon]|nr:hypothetical protein [Euryarchaeota archaeon]
MEITVWAGLTAFVGAVLVYLSRDQPFPEISRKHGIFLLLIAGTLMIASTSPRDFEKERISALLVTIFAGIQLVIGVWHMTINRRDVIVGPLVGILLCLGAGVLFADDWFESTTTEQATAFLTLAFLVMLEIYLFFRGMIVGTSARMWSAAGLRQIQRGLLEGKRGAVGCFERAWDMEEEYINAMSHLALEKIHSSLGNNSAAEEHHEKFQQLGGMEAIDSAWVEAIEISVYGKIISESE